uniref:Ig-like domain-containing protein n=3 Tax=Equus TaxID=9789 RepID=A0A3Q2HCI8_HORSE
MDTWALCCVLLCLLGVEPIDSGVTQEPRHQVTKMGQDVTLRCEPISSHTDLFWYRQTSVQGLEFLIYFSNQAVIDQTGMPKDRFSAEMPNRSFSTLKIQHTEPRDSAVYLCASSLATALQNQVLPVQKPL